MLFIASQINRHCSASLAPMYFSTHLAAVHLHHSCIIDPEEFVKTCHLSDFLWFAFRLFLKNEPIYICILRLCMGFE